MVNKIKVSAPAINPHICYVNAKYKGDIQTLRQRYNLSFYRILCVNAGKELCDKAAIAEYKKNIRKKGYRNIGEYAEDLIAILILNPDITIQNLGQLELTRTKLTKQEN